MRESPLVSVITPSLNSAQFLEATIQSVLAQDYPRIEYLVMDGGSTDGTLDILRSHADRLTYVSERDDGAADAINQGFAKAQGEILAWLGADDTYLPGAVSKAVQAFAAHPDAAVVYGEGYWIGPRGEVLGRYPTAPYDPKMFTRECSVCQPACFIRREAMEAVGMLNPGLRASFDYDLWIRLAKRYRFVHLPEYLANSRMHPETRPSDNGERSFGSPSPCCRNITAMCRWNGFTDIFLSCATIAISSSSPCANRFSPIFWRYQLGCDTTTRNLSAMEQSGCLPSSGLTCRGYGGRRGLGRRRWGWRARACVQRDGGSRI